MLCMYMSLKKKTYTHVDILFNYTYKLTKLYPISFAITETTIPTENDNLSRIYIVDNKFYLVKRLNLI